MIRHLQEWEEWFLNGADRHLPKIAPYFRKYARTGRFIVSGGTSAVVDLGLLYVFTDRFGAHYLLSAALAFIAAFFVSFTLQKFWTFEDSSTKRVPIQMSLSFIIASINLGFNTALMYVFVEKLNIWYMGAQVIVGIILAFESFFILRSIIFRKPPAQGIERI